jgi:hypothetical protein
MTPNQERWAEALKIEQIHGDTAPAWVAQRIEALALEGDEAGVARLRVMRLALRGFGRSRLGWTGFVTRGSFCWRKRAEHMPRHREA